MELPALTSIEGAYWYLISIIVLIAVVCGLYVAAATMGFAPEPSRLIDNVPYLAPTDAIQATSNAASRSASIASALLES